jgi:hypothetical protein
MASTQLRIQTEQSSYCVGDEFIAHVLLDTPSVAVNAAQGTLEYDASHVSPIAIQYGDSFLRYWVTPPRLPERAGEIPFTGGLPFPGYQGNGGKVMSIVFRADAAGVTTDITIRRDAQVLLNDGLGTSTDVSFQDRRVALIESNAAVCEVAPPATVEQSDVTPPLPFNVIIERTEKAFDGDYFAVFDTTDAGTGVSFYEVRETSPYVNTPWFRTDSPYRLQAQGGRTTVFVRAVDGAGNVQLSSASADLQAKEAALSSTDTLVLVGAVLLTLWLVILCRRREE